MTDQYILSIDPGKSSGVALLAYNDREAWLEGSWQFGGGSIRLRNFINYRFGWDEVPGQFFVLKEYPQFSLNPVEEPWRFTLKRPHGNGKYDNLTVIAEKFTARNTQGFSYTTDSLEPLRGEGVLLALEVMPDYSPNEKRWRDPKLQYLVGGKDKADKKKRQHKFLKDSGFYVVPSALGTTDADDFRSACAHGLAYLQRELKHRGVHAMVSEWMENN